MVVDTTIHDRSGLLLGESPPPTDADINRAELVGIAAIKAGDRGDISQLIAYIGERNSQF